MCFFYKFSLHFSFPSFVPSVCIYPPLCFCSFSSYSLSEYLLFSLPIICFLKVFFPPLAFSSPRVSLFILLFYLFPFVVFCYYSFIVNSFIFCCSFFLLPLLFPSSPQLSFSIFHPYSFLFFSFPDLLSFHICS